MYISHASNKVEFTYLGQPQLEICDASSIVAALNFFLVTKNFNINNCIAIGSDNASVMVGINNRVHSKLKQENPSVILMRCVCQSKRPAMSYASSVCLPINMEYLIAETHKLFEKSLVRQSHNNEIHKQLMMVHIP